MSNINERANEISSQKVTGIDPGEISVSNAPIQSGFGSPSQPEAEGVVGGSDVSSSIAERVLSGSPISYQMKAPTPVANARQESRSVSSTSAAPMQTQDRQQKTTPAASAASGLSTSVTQRGKSSAPGADVPDSQVGRLGNTDLSLSESGPVDIASSGSPQANSAISQASATPNEQEEETKIVEQERQRYQENTHRQNVRLSGVVKKPAPRNFVSRANTRFKESKKAIQNKIKTTLRGKNYSGDAFNETIVSDRNVAPHCVSIGSELLYEALREPNSTIVDLVNEKLAAAGSQESLTREECLNDVSKLVNAINSLEIEVVLQKTPVNIANSIQVRTLRAHYGRGLRLHPSQTKSYNADFDGDTGFLNINQSNLGKYSRAMDHLIDIEGNATIDPDFFPVDQISSNMIDDNILVMRLNYFGFDRDAVDGIKKAYVNLCNQPDRSKSPDQYWREFLHAVDDTAAKEARRIPGYHKNTMASAILQAVYNFGVDKRGYSVLSQFDRMDLSDAYERLPQNTDPFVINLLDLFNEISAGRPAMSFPEFNVFFNKYYGDVKGRKNVPFRLLADFAKAVNRTDLIAIGDGVWGTNFRQAMLNSDAMIANASDSESEVTMYQLWEFTCSAAMSKRIKGQSKLGSRSLAVSTKVKTNVIREVGFPVFNDPNRTVDEQFRDWVDRFIDSYNANKRMLNIAETSFVGGMGIIRSEGTAFDGVKTDRSNLAECLVKVYGDFTVSKLFPDSVVAYRDFGKNPRYQNNDTGIIDKFRDMPIEMFSMCNRFSFPNETVRDAKGNVLRDGRGDPVTIARMIAIEDRLKNNSYSPMDVLLAIADRRTKQTGRFGESWLKATDKHAKIFVHIKECVDRKDFNGYVSDMLELMHLMSPDMFDFFGMDSPIMFVESGWGKKLLDASGNTQQFRSILVSMMVEYRFARSSSLLDTMNELSEVEEYTENIANRIDSIDAVYRSELESLGSSSDVWSAIVKEYEDEGFDTWPNVFKQVQSKGELRSNWKTDAKSFWLDPSNLEKYPDLLSFLKSDADYETKVNVLCDFAKVKTGYPYITPGEVVGQLAHHPDRLHAGSRFDMDQDLSSEIDAVKSSLDGISSYMSKAPFAIVKESKKLVGYARSNKNAFEKRLARFASDPGYFTHIDLIIAADAIASIFDKTYADSEKIKQQAVVNGYFEALSLQKNGGFYTHLQQTDNAVVNVIGFDQLSSLDVVRVLGDPTIELFVYDEFGRISALSRLSLCGGNSIDDVIDFLEKNPRISLSCRGLVAGVRRDVNGSGKLSAVDDGVVEDTGISQVFSLLNDRPRFLSIAALITPSSQNVGRNLSERIAENIDNLCVLVNKVAHDNKDAYSALLEFESVLGITVDTFEDGSRLDEEGYVSLYTDVMGELLDCVEVVQNSGISFDREEFSYKFKPDLIGIDEVSIVSFYDARQQLSGARTAKMIGIEGSETKKNLILKEYLKHRPDRFMTVTNDMSDAELMKLAEMSGTSIADIRDELDRSRTGSFVIEVPEGWQPSDLSLEGNRNKQKGSICKFLEVKREKGAETYNAKTKKYGDDGTNSIIKFFKFATEAMLARFGKKDGLSIEASADLRRRIAACSSKDQAIPILAKALIEADKRLGYTDDAVFVESDYWNRADLMLADDLSIRTIEQLSVACRNRLSDDALASEDENVILNELNEIVSTVGTQADPFFISTDDVLINCLNNIPIQNSMKAYRVDRALRARSSSADRNYALLFKLFNKFAENETQRTYKTNSGSVRYIAPSRENINRLSDSMYKKLDKETAELMQGVAYPYMKFDFNRQEYVKGDNYGYIYDYLGRPYDDGFVLIPGPQSLVLFDQEFMDQKSSAIFDKCEEYGMTAAFTSISSIPAKYRVDAIQLGNGLYILPFFDMMLNGAASNPIAPAPAQIPFNRENAVVCVENTTYEFGPGDATFHITKELVDRIRVFFRDNEIISAYDLFPNVVDSFPNSRLKLQFCSREEVERYIVNAEMVVTEDGVEMQGFTNATLDIGVRKNGPNDPSFNREAERMKIRIQEYVNRFNEVEEDSNTVITGDLRYDSIIGFVKVEIDRDTFVLAPVLPFHLEDSGSVPTTYKATMDIDVNTNSVVVNWEYSGSLLGQFIKFFEGIGSSNKMIASTEPVPSRTLANGLPIDGFYSTKSIASRLFASNKRIQTLISTMMIPRLDSNYAYNFAELEDSFPGNPTFTRTNDAGEEIELSIKEALLDGALGFTDWVNIYRSNIAYHSDPEINGIVKGFVAKCVEFGTVNPSILLSTKTRAGISWPMYTEFEAFFEPSYNFQNGFMKLMNKMNPTLVPESIEADASACLFKPVKNGDTDEDYGVLQMMVPTYDMNGKEAGSVPQNVYISFGFFGEEFSGFKKVNINAFNESLDSLNVANNINQFELSQVLAFGRAGMSSVPKSNTVEAFYKPKASS